MPQPAVELRRTITAHAAARARITIHAAGMAAAAARGFDGWYDSAAITRWATGLAGRVEVLQRTAARVTDAYLAQVLSGMVGAAVRPVGVVDVSALRGGITHPGAYGRAADVYRYQQHLYDEVAFALLDGPTAPPGVVLPVEAAAQRAAAVADMDVQLAFRAQLAASLTGRRGVVGYRRVIAPELATGDVCGLCVAAAERLHRVTELLPVHGRCQCGAVPVTSGADPGAELNDADSAGLAAEPFDVAAHDELGPVLTARGATLTRHRTAPTRPPLPPAEKTVRLSELRDRLGAAQPRATELAAADPATWSGFAQQLAARVDGLNKELAAT